MSKDVNFLAKMIELPFSQWKLNQCIILDWYDAPLEGFCDLEAPSISFYFKLFAINKKSNGKDSFIYKAYVSDSRSIVTDFRERVGQLSEPVYPFWNPLLINDTTLNLNINKEIKSLITQFELQPQFLVHSKGMKKFMGVWKLLH